MKNSNFPLNPESRYLTFGNLHISSIQSVVIIATAIAYYSSQNSQIGHNLLHFGTVAALIIGGLLLITSLIQEKKLKLNVWHLLVLFSVFAFVFSYEATSHAQILEQIDEAISGVGTAAGGSFAADVLTAIIELVRIAIFIVVGAAVIAAIAFGVTQGQWQAPLLVVGTVAGIGLFLEIMGVVVFG